MPLSSGTASREGLSSPWKLEGELKALGHYPTRCDDADKLKLHFGEQLEKLSVDSE